jgi:hypothetical protein
VVRKFSAWPYDTPWGWLGCKSHQAYFALLAMILLDPVLVLLLGQQWTNTEQLTYVGAFFAGMLLVTFAERGHGSAICFHCEGSMPINPCAEAEAQERWLRLYHGILPYSALYSIVLTGVLVATAWLAPQFVKKPAVTLVVTVYIGFHYLVYRTGTLHRRYLPWCPVCGWQRGGGDEGIGDAPEPDHPPGRALNRTGG